MIKNVDNWDAISLYDEYFKERKINENIKIRLKELQRENRELERICREYTSKNRLIKKYMSLIDERLKSIYDNKNT